MSRARRLLTAVAVVAVLAAGCSKSSPATSAKSNGSSRDQALQFAACMRTNGVKDFPDPPASGELTIDAIANGSSVDTNTAQFKQALDACKNLEPPGFTGQQRTPEQQQAALQFAQCIRDSGVKDFPDPTSQSPLIDTTRIPSTGTPSGMSILHAAMKKCGDLAGEAGVHAP